MSQKLATVTLHGDAMQFVARSGSGHSLTLDDGEGNTGPRPAELVPMAVAACTAMDVISILRKKRQEVTGYEVRAAAEQRDGATPAVFTRIDVEHVVEGPALDVEAVRRSIELSATRYCPVVGTLSTGVTEIRHSYLVRSAGGERRGTVVVTGPHEEPDALGHPAAEGADTD
jgi:putative redox protein